MKCFIKSTQLLGWAAAVEVIYSDPLRFMLQVVMETVAQRPIAHKCNPLQLFAAPKIPQFY